MTDIGVTHLLASAPLLLFLEEQGTKRSQQTTKMAASELQRRSSRNIIRLGKLNNSFPNFPKHI